MEALNVETATVYGAASRTLFACALSEDRAKVDRKRFDELRLMLFDEEMSTLKELAFRFSDAFDCPGGKGALVNIIVPPGKRKNRHRQLRVGIALKARTEGEIGRQGIKRNT